MRLNQYIAQNSVFSRRKADELIKRGKVRVNQKVVTDFSFRLKDSDTVSVAGKKLEREPCRHFLFHKPQGVTTTLHDKHAPKKVSDFFPSHWHLYPVGRLDKDSSGLLILTNDGDFCYRLTHPKFEVEKEYALTVEGILKNADCRKLVEGARIDGDFLKAKSVKIISRRNNQTTCSVVVCEGKKRHLRRLFSYFGYPVKKLGRLRVGTFTLGSLKPGQYRRITKKELHAFKKALEN